MVRNLRSEHELCEGWRLDFSGHDKSMKDETKRDEDNERPDLPDG